MPELLYSSNDQPFSFFDYEHHFIEHEHEHEWKPAGMVCARHNSRVCSGNSSGLKAGSCSLSGSGLDQRFFELQQKLRWNRASTC